MNIKKIVSAVSALAISVSAFAGMAVVANAETYASQDYQAESATVDWTTKNGGRFDPILLTDGDNVYLSVDQSTRNNNGTTITGTTVNGAVAAGADFTMEWDMKLSSSTNQTPAEFKIYDAANSTAMLSITATGTWANNWYLNGNTNKVVTLPNSNKGGGSDTIADVTWCHYVLTRSGDTTLLTITDANDNVVYERATIDTLSSTGGLGKMEFVTKRYNANFAIDNIVVRSVEAADLPEIASVNYTVNYVFDETVVKTLTDSNYVGEVITADAFVYSDAGVKYFVSDDATTSMTLAEGTDNVLNVAVRAANNYTVTVNAVGDIEKVIGTHDAVEGETIEIPYSTYIMEGNVLYSTSARSSNPWWGVSVSNVTDNSNYDLTYTKAVENVVYYSEAEDIEGLTVTNEGYIPIRTSNEKGAYVTAETEITTLPAGKYKIVLTSYGNAGVTFNAYTDSVSEENLIGSVSTDGNPKENTSEEFVLTEDTAIVLGAAGNGGNSPKVLDYIYIIKTGDYVDPDSEAVAATLAADFADTALTDGTEGASVWTASIEGTGIAYNTITATATSTDDIEASASFDATTITTTGTVDVIVIVNRMAELLKSVVLSVE